MEIGFVRKLLVITRPGMPLGVGGLEVLTLLAQHLMFGIVQLMCDPNHSKSPYEVPIIM